MKYDWTDWTPTEPLLVQSDRFTRAADYRRMDKRVDAFLEVKKKYDPQGRLRSAQSARLELT